MHELGAKHGRRITVWHDPLNNGATIGKDAIIESWNGDSKFANTFAARGWQTIMASPYYLDAIERQWSDFYNVEFPPSENATVESNMIGGEACVSGPANPVSCPARLTRPVRCIADVERVG